MVLYNKELFTLAEAQEAGLDWVYWRDPDIKAGDYVLTDDDCVVRIKSVNNMRNSKGYPARLLRTVIGTINQFGGTNLKGAEIVAGRNNPEDKTFKQYRQIKQKIKPQEKQVIDLVVNGMDPVTAYSVVFPGNTPRYTIQHKVRLLFTTPAALRYMGSQLKKKLEAAGLTEDWWFEQLRTIITDPDVQSAVRWDALKTVGHMHEILESPVRAELTHTQSIMIDSGAINMLEQAGVQEAVVVEEGNKNDMEA